jgi:hypothetical protein
VTAVLTIRELEAIRRRCEQATPGPWFNCGNTVDDCRGVPFAQAFGRFEGRSHDTFCRNAAFLAHARQDVPRLLEEVDRLRALTGAAGADVPAEGRGSGPKVRARTRRRVLPVGIFTTLYVARMRDGTYRSVEAVSWQDAKRHLGSAAVSIRKRLVTFEEYGQQYGYDQADEQDARRLLYERER